MNTKSIEMDFTCLFLEFNYVQASIDRNISCSDANVNIRSTKTLSHKVTKINDGKQVYKYIFTEIILYTFAGTLLSKVIKHFRMSLAVEVHIQPDHVLYWSF